MEVVRQSLRPIDGLRKMYPGTWEYQGTFWHGELFDIAKRGGKFYRLDTGKQIEIFPHRKRRSHFIYQLLEDKFGGTWAKHEYLPRWTSKQHPFFVYRTTERPEGNGTRPVYRRSDSAEIVYRSSARRFYEEEYEGHERKKTCQAMK